jgi:excisionase family DNA binding protein
MIDFTITDKEDKSQKTPMPDLAEFMTTDQAAKALDFTVESVRQLVYKKKLESQRFGRSILIPRKAVKEYLEKTKGMNKKDPRRSLKK